MQVVKQLLGEEPLPWERMTVATRKTLGAFKGPIMQLLNRDPSQRPSMSQFYDNCNAIFSTSTTYTPANKASMGSSNTSDVMHVESGATSSANNTEAAIGTEGAATTGSGTEGANTTSGGGLSPGASGAGSTGTASTPALTEGASINGSTEMPRLATQTIRE